MSILLGNVFEEFLQRVTEKQEQVSAMIISDFHSYRERRAQKDAPKIKSERLAEIGFYLTEGLHVLLTLFPSNEAKSISDGFQRRVNGWIDWQLSPEAAPELQDIISTILPVAWEYPNYFCHHRGCLCVQPDTLCDLLRSKFKDPTIERQQVIRLLRERGALKMDKSGAATKKVGKIRLLHIIPQRLS